MGKVRRRTHLRSCGIFECAAGLRPRKSDAAETVGLKRANVVTFTTLQYHLLLVRTELNAAFRLFKKYSLINFRENEEGEDMKIELYPSLQFGWDIPQFQTVVKEYLRETTEDGEMQREEDLAVQTDPEDFEEEDE